MPTLRDKFRGCLLGAAVGDVAGAPVEAESPGYIARTYRSVDDILAAGNIGEFAGPDWRVGRFTDDTQMTLCVAEWLLAGEAPSPRHLLGRFAGAWETWRRYGPGTEAVLRLYRQHPEQWRELASAAFPEGSYGNGSATRVAPVGLVHHRDPKMAASVAIESSRPTHSHSLAYQGAVLQCLAVAAAAGAGGAPAFAPDPFLHALRGGLARFSDLMQDTSRFSAALDAIGRGLARGTPCAEMSAVLGTGVAAHESVPMAFYCFLLHPDSYPDVIHEAVFAGGDTDTIASMAGAISGALLGSGAIPPRWRDAVREETYSADVIEDLADRLCGKYVA
jgi:poly(ADP-ribose) glycohydrolase ARH3